MAACCQVQGWTARLVPRQPVTLHSEGLHPLPAPAPYRSPTPSCAPLPALQQGGGVLLRADPLRRLRVARPHRGRGRALCGRERLGGGRHCAPHLRRWHPCEWKWKRGGMGGGVEGSGPLGQQRSQAVAATAAAAAAAAGLRLAARSKHLEAHLAAAPQPPRPLCPIHRLR